MRKSSFKTNDSKALIKELVRSSPKKYAAVLITDSEDSNQKKAILVSESDSLESDIDYHYRLRKHRSNLNKYNKKYLLNDFDDISSDSLDDDSDIDRDSLFDYTDSPSDESYEESQISNYSATESYVSSQYYSSCSPRSYSSYGSTKKQRTCPYCSKVLSDSSYLSENCSNNDTYSYTNDSISERSSISKPKRNHVHFNDSRHKSPKKYPYRQPISNHKQKRDSGSLIQEIIERYQKKIAEKRRAERMRQEEEQRRVEEAEIERRRKNIVSDLLEQLRRRKENPDYSYSEYSQHPMDYSYNTEYTYDDYIYSNADSYVNSYNYSYE